MRLSIARLAFAATVLLPIAAVAQDPAQVKITLTGGASVTGVILPNAQNQSVQAFRGIRYAEAPTGDKRWKPSTLLKPTGDINATALGNICYTDSRFDAAPLFPQSEDCLFLNVYAPAGASAKSKLPVMVWTHGGSWVSGSGNIYDGRNLVGVAGNDVVYVSFNYRLGLFGLLANAQLLSEGNGANAALRDMQNAYQWVRDHIRSFGGDPDDVTAFGESAGAFMIALQMLTDGGKQRLFDKVLLESGAYPSFAQVMTVAEQNAYVSAVATKVGCTDATQTLACLRGKDASSLMAAGGNKDWRPIVDGKFLVDLPYKLVAADKVSKIPTVMGTNTDEGYLFTYSVAADEAVIPAIAAGFPGLTSDDLATIATLYPSASFDLPAKRAGEILGDLIFVCPSEKMAETLAAREPTYHYRFNQTSPFFGVGPELVIHTAEMSYVFNDNSNLPSDTETKTLVANVQKFWTNFARYGSPNGATDGASAAWPRYDAQRKQQIVLQKTLGVETNGAYMPLHAERCVFWNKVEARVANGTAYLPTK